MSRGAERGIEGERIEEFRIRPVKIVDTENELNHSGELIIKGRTIPLNAVVDVSLNPIDGEKK